MRWWSRLEHVHSTLTWPTPEPIVPGWLAVWGIVGYAALAAGALLELVGVAVGLALSVPGGLFEVALGLILIARGFPESLAIPPATQLRAAHARFGASA
jgi:hypothetical protein